MQQFKKFCFVGGLGFVVDSLLFLLLTQVTDNVMLARLLSFWFAATATWLGNRIYTYSHQQSLGIMAQWSKHMLSAHLSGTINLAIFWLVKDIAPIPVAFFLGVLSGLFSNYFFANRFVFVNSQASNSGQ
jgi:putative flippase GtrA